jgi:hypothetical protein
MNYWLCAQLHRLAEKTVFSFITWIFKNLCKNLSNVHHQIYCFQKGDWGGHIIIVALMAQYTLTLLSFNGTLCINLGLSTVSAMLSIYVAI